MMKLWVIPTMKAISLGKKYPLMMMPTTAWLSHSIEKFAFSMLAIDTVGYSDGVHTTLKVQMKNRIRGMHHLIIIKSDVMPVITGIGPKVQVRAAPFI